MIITNYIVNADARHPAVMLVIGLLILTFLIWFFWPRNGGLEWLTKIYRHNKRIQLEDALKFIFDCEYNKVKCDINAIAGNLNIATDTAGELIGKLMELEFIHFENQFVTLTDEGRSYALRIIRIHRVWERYLADQTGVKPTDWHNVADRLEHHVSQEKIEILAASIGNPVFDPHGDPIPTKKGELPDAKGVLLNTMKEREMGKIIHLEDEPSSIFEQLNVLGLHPGMSVYITEVNDKKITFVADGEECTLTPLFAGQVKVEKDDHKTILPQKHELLSSLEIGDEAIIKGISTNCRGPQRRRLLDLGIVPGSRIKALMKSASGNPVAYNVMGTTIGIRKKEAGLIFIDRIKIKEHAHT